MNKEIHNYFLEISKDINHSDSTYASHCEGVYKILKKLNQPEHVCLAGLFHSAYGTEYFNVPTCLTRKELSNVIGTTAEQLVYMFCNIRNRYDSIINNSFNFNKNIHTALVAIEYANLKEQSVRIKDDSINEMCNCLLEILSKNNEVISLTISEKDIIIFDNIMTNSDAEFLNEYCLNSVFTTEHSSHNNLHYDIDSRFVANMSEDDFINSGIVPSIKQIANFLDKDLFIGNYYINHYGLMTGVSKHTDSAFSDHYTILVFCNNYWEDTWGGEIAFYDDNTPKNALIEFKPKRIILFDSRISHKVLPMTRNARKDRYTMAIKCATKNGLDSLKKQYPNIVGVSK